MPLSARASPYWSLLAVFGCWKLVLGSIALATPSPAYDTSTSLALPPLGAAAIGSRFLEALCSRLTRWDAIYFTKVAERGYANEQEWAFGWGYTQAIVATRKAVFSIISGQIGLQEAISAIILSNACHLASAIVLYKLTRLCSNESPRSKSVAWLAAALHILSPAGLFLSAPYSESFFSFLSFSGTYLYGLSLKMIGSKQRLAGNTLTLLSAIIFCGASTVRSNGLLNGILFLFDFASTLYSILRRERGTGLWSAIRLVVLGMGGLLVGLGVVFPQYLAWQEFCVPDGGRPWCTKLVPSIYTWVQDFYWNVGMFRYWTLSNIPLFLLATPTLLVLFSSGVWGVQLFGKHSLSEDAHTNAGGDWNLTSIGYRLAITQIALAGMAVFAYHVQVITRLSSSCVVCYWWAAVTIAGDPKGRWIVKGMVVYGLVQGVLFAGFLPPA